jgi:hypothetical protein
VYAGAEPSRGGGALLSPERAATTGVAVSDPTCHPVSATRILVLVAAPIRLAPVAHAGRPHCCRGGATRRLWTVGSVLVTCLMSGTTAPSEPTTQFRVGGWWWCGGAEENWSRSTSAFLRSHRRRVTILLLPTSAARNLASPGRSMAGSGILIPRSTQAGERVVMGVAICRRSSRVQRFAAAGAPCCDL